MKRLKKNKGSVFSLVVEIDISKEKSDAIYLSPNREMRDNFEFAMIQRGTEFCMQNGLGQENGV
ncbi:MAG: hypothetical protein M1556_01985 [Candidatus Thermoplasmatota archaeon]|jgi:hypothetical protein|nr:hypothetical protein [Candidatus Thermoplasmatota archaeon]MCL6002401.1 hypothetical protein [Candidatus Thermoplasmatota archaeon]